MCVRVRGAGGTLNAWGGLAERGASSGGWWGQWMTGACFHFLGFVELPQPSAS